MQRSFARLLTCFGLPGDATEYTVAGGGLDPVSEGRIIRRGLKASAHDD